MNKKDENTDIQKCAGFSRAGWIIVIVLFLLLLLLLNSLIFGKKGDMRWFLKSQVDQRIESWLRHLDSWTDDRADND